MSTSCSNGGAHPRDPAATVSKWRFGILAAAEVNIRHGEGAGKIVSPELVRKRKSGCRSKSFTSFLSTSCADESASPAATVSIVTLRILAVTKVNIRHGGDATKVVSLEITCKRKSVRVRNAFHPWANDGATSSAATVAQV